MYHHHIRAIILHFWLAYGHPFVDGNGRTARALFYWAMLHEGYWLFEFISISNILRKAPAQYGLSFLYSETDDNDLTYFIVAQTKVIRRAGVAHSLFSEWLFLHRPEVAGGVNATRQGRRGGRETRCRGARPRADQRRPPTPPRLARAGPNNPQSRAWAARPP